MSHFTVTVAIPGSVDPAKLEAALEDIMAPFDEGLEVDRYVSATKAELIENAKASYMTVWAGPGGYIERYAKDPAAYRAEFRSEHVKHIEGLIAEDRLNTWSDERWYQDAIEYESAENIGPNGETYSEYNPKSEWDWYVVGGRWGCFWTLKEGLDPTDKDIVPIKTHEPWGGATDRSNDPRNIDCARKENIAAESHVSTYAYVDLEGEWISQGKMGWFGMSSGDKAQEDWDTQYFEWIKELPSDTWLVLVDAHI